MVKRALQTLLNVFCYALLFLALMLPAAGYSQSHPVKPSAADKCPVCGMFVSKYPDWIAELAFKDGTIVFFDGVKDLFKYYFALPKYAPNRTDADIDAIYVTEYYTVELIDGASAYYVVGSDVLGPMGHELIPLASEDDAKAFSNDHGSKQILRFKDVTPQIIGTLD